ncbi:MAG: 2-isopropylmalate synthase, partial [Flavobacteriales bacterium]|nr:2-isopropylmalate synthase [Flavobacteriales bacterium]
MDTTLRDGEQTAGISFKPSEKLTLAKILLDELNIDRLEVASALVSVGELDAVKRIANWANEAGHLQRIEVLTFVDKGRSIKWMKRAGVKVQNLLTKGSLNHLEHQLRKIPEEHFSDISEVLQIAVAAGIDTNVYLE